MSGGQTGGGQTSGGRGVLYIATGAAHAEAARLSAASVRASNPGLAIAIRTDQPLAGPEFDLVEPVPDPHRRSKVDHLGASPFARTLYLDSDTRVRGDLTDMFGLVERFDMACALRELATGRHRRARGRGDVPASLPEYNSGVLLYRRSGPVDAFFTAWQEAYRSLGKAPDQPAFRDALWASDVRITVLTPHYNARRFDPVAWLLRGERPAILHMNRFHPTKRRRVHALMDPLLGR